MSKIRTEIEINASVEKVWKELTDFEKFPDWNPFIKEVILLDEKFELGSKLKTNVDGTTFKPKVTRLIPNKQFHWLGVTFIPKIFDGRHMFDLEELGDDKVKLIHHEEFKGILAWPVMKLIGKKTKIGFESMNQALKERVEAS